MSVWKHIFYIFLLMEDADCDGEMGKGFERDRLGIAQLSLAVTKGWPCCPLEPHNA